MLCCSSERSEFVFPICGKRKRSRVVPIDALPLTPPPARDPSPAQERSLPPPTKDSQRSEVITCTPPVASVSPLQRKNKQETVKLSASASFTEKTRKMAVPGRLLATYQLLPDFQYNSALQCYVDNPDSLDENIPGPHPPPNKKADIFNHKDYADVDERAVTTPVSFHRKTLKELVEHLISGYEDDLSKIRVIYRWITCQPIEALNLRKVPSQNHALFQLWRIKNKKGNYAQLVSLLCRYANVPCVIIHGVLKGSTYEVGDKINDDKHYGEWNAVLIDGHWRFINAYWGTCAEGSTDGAFDDSEIPNGDDVIQNGGSGLHYFCDENYFLTDPDQVVATHLPQNPSWQLKANPLSMEEFEQMTFVKDRYFNLRLRTLSHKKCVVESDTGEVEVKFGIPKDSAVNIDFQYLLFRLKDGTEERVDRYVFMHRTNNNENLTIKIRTRDPTTFRFELVGKDTTITEPNYDYDWIAIYKIIFSQGLEDCQPFPPTPVIGWGPGRVARDTGLAPLSHFTGEVFMDDHGRAEIIFGFADNTRAGDEMIYAAKVYTGGEKMEELPDTVVHRVENGDVKFNAITPRKGEYVLRLFVKDTENPKMKEFCDYLLISRQTEENGKFPKGFQSRLGPKFPAFSSSGLSPMKPSGLIQTDTEEVHIGFNRAEDIELSVNFSGEKVKPAEAPRLLSVKEKDAIVIYTVRLPEPGQYGVKVRGSREDGGLHVPLYDYVIDYRIAKVRDKNGPTIKEEVESTSSLSESLSGSTDEKETSEEKAVSEDLEDEASVDNEENHADKLRRRMRMAIEEASVEELKVVLKNMKELKIKSVEPDIKYGEEELTFIKIKKELITAIRDKDSRKLKAAINKAKAAGVEDRLEKEITLAQNLLERLKKLQRLLHAILDLDQSTIAEIRGYSKPPPVVHTVMMSTLLLLGHWEEETKDWKKIQILLGKTGKESLKRQIMDFKIEDCPLEAAMGAKDNLRDYSIDQVRLVSAGCATFFVWVKGVVEEIEKRAGDEINNIRPLTSRGTRKKSKVSMTFLGDITADKTAAL